MGAVKLSEDGSRVGFDRRSLLKAGAASALLAVPPTTAAAKEVASGTPPHESQMVPEMPGKALSPDRLQRLRVAMARHVESGYVPGLVAAVWRKGELHVEVLGTMAFGGLPMRRDTIFRIASITKPITAAAAMILVEESRLRLDDPVDKWLPELADRRVLKSIESPLDETVPAVRPITLRDLLTFRAGYGAVMVWPEKYPIQKAMSEAGLLPSANLPAMPPEELMKRYGASPLVHQPGEQWLYNSASDILGVLISRVSGRTLEGFLRERIFGPLGMKDTGFHVPAEKIDRLATCYQTDLATGERAVFDEARGGRFASPPVFESGAGGLVSTVDDYLAFCRMMLGKGKLGDTRILSRPTVELMTADHLTPAQKEGDHARIFFNGNSGWGFGMAVATRRDNLWLTPGRFGWDGGYGTSAYTDPVEEMVGVLLTQRLMDSPAPPPIYIDFWTSAYQAIAD